jgi:hypothetical protein
MENEVWMNIKGYEGYYQISNLGRVKSLERITIRKKGTSLRKGRILKHTKNQQGYELVNLCKNSKVKFKAVHRIVMESFIPNIENKPCVNHINGIKTDNTLNNLEWCTYSENSLHAYRTGLKTVSEKSIENSRLKCSKKIINTENGDIFSSIKEAAISINMKYKTLTDKLTGRRFNNTPLKYL